MSAAERLWRHALKRAGSAVDPETPPPPLPSLKMRELTFALLHFLELLDPLVPETARAAWTVELTLARAHLEGRADDLLVFQPVPAAASWENLARALRQAVLRAAFAPGLAGVAQRPVVGIAFSLLRERAPSRIAANEEIRKGLVRLEAGLWLAAARARLGDQAKELDRGVWGGPHLALFTARGKRWWLVQLPPGRPIAVEKGERDDVLAIIPDAHFAAAVSAALQDS